MKIGIEASRLTEKQRTGTENYLFNLVREFSRLDKKNDYTFYFREKPSESLWSEISQHNPKFSYKVVPKILSWTQIGLALELFMDTPDVLFCTWHTMPGFNPFWKMSTISAFHDATGLFLPSFWTAHFSSRVIGVSERTRDEVSRRFGISPARISLIPEGRDESLQPASDSEITKLKQKHNISGEYILFLGSLGPRKNLEKMVEAHSGLSKKVEFVAAGKVMPGSEQLAKLPIKYIGRADQDDLAALYSGAAFLAFVSKEEGFGLPIVEAQACGCAVLAADIKVMRETAGEGALYVDPTSVEKIREGMEKLLTDSSLRKELIEKGFENVKRFSWENSAREILQVFEETKNGK